jgi:hypothetical protein
MLAHCIGKIQAQIYEKAFFVASFGSLYPELGPEGGELKIKNVELKIKNASSFISATEAQQAERGPLSNETSDPNR